MNGNHDSVIFPTGDELPSVVMTAARRAGHQAVGAYLMRDRGNYRGKIGDALRGCFHYFVGLFLGALAEASFCEEEATLYTWEGGIKYEGFSVEAVKEHKHCMKKNLP